MTFGKKRIYSIIFVVIGYLSFSSLASPFLLGDKKFYIKDKNDIYKFSYRPSYCPDGSKLHSITTNVKEELVTETVTCYYSDKTNRMFLDIVWEGDDKISESPYFEETLWGVSRIKITKEVFVVVHFCGGLVLNVAIVNKYSEPLQVYSFLKPLVKGEDWPEAIDLAEIAYDYEQTQWVRGEEMLSNVAYKCPSQPVGLESNSSQSKWFDWKWKLPSN